MSFESPDPLIEISPEYEGYIPKEFLENPLKYFEEHGENIKSGEVKIDEGGIIRDDPTATRFLPRWENDDGETLEVVAKRVNPIKGVVGEIGDSLHEYKVMQMIAELGLPTAKPVGYVEHGKDTLILTERINGFRWSGEEKERLVRDYGFTEEEIGELISQAQVEMERLRGEFQQRGIKRGWKLADMVFQIDTKKKTLLGIVPVDWERTRISE